MRYLKVKFFDGDTYVSILNIPSQHTFTNFYQLCRGESTELVLSLTMGLGSRPVVAVAGVPEMIVFLQYSTALPVVFNSCKTASI